MSAWKVCCTLSLLAACGEKPSGEDDPSGEGWLITAAEGGTIELDGATLVIPPGALAEDTTITADPFTAGGEVVAAAWDFGPDGLEFQSPAELSFTADLSGSGTPMVAWYDGSAWQTVPSTVDGEVVTGQIEHFTPFSVVLVGDDQIEGACDVEGFQSCGGDPVGTWTYTAGCLSLKEPPEMPCDSATFTLVLDASGTVTFDAGGTYTADSVITTVMTMRIPKSCFPVPVPCSDIDEEAIDDGDACLMTQTDEEVDTGSGTWAADGTTLTFDAGTEDEGVTSFCAQANTLDMLFLGEDADVIYHAER